jgi:16S rRNA C967 or C1407 C5-methylase (RsmB/RsmF family)
MDVSSGAGVAALLTNDHDQEDGRDKQPSVAGAVSKSVRDNDEIRVLDLCACPGLKLLTMADYFYQQAFKKKIKLVGVDVNSNRMEKCKSIVQKYWVNPTTSEGAIGNDIHLQLYVADGTTFGSTICDNSSDSDSLVFDSRVAFEEVKEQGKRKRVNKSARARQRKRLRDIAAAESNQRGVDGTASGKKSSIDIEKFDYVLVDAECSTDGSFKHVKERIKESMQMNGTDSALDFREMNSRLTDHNELSELVDLQKRLIQSGFSLLKTGGTLVYSTCSFSHHQNEEVVQWLLETNQDAFMIPVHYPVVAKSECVVQGSLKGTIRFYPYLSMELASDHLLLGDGFFVAKIGKKDSL